MKPVPRAPRFFITWAYLNIFLVDKTSLIWKCATCKVFFMYWSLTSDEYYHEVIMQSRFPSGVKFWWGGHFLRCFIENFDFKRKQFDFWIFKFLKILKFHSFKIIHFSNTISFWKILKISKFHFFIFQNLKFLKIWKISFLKNGAIPL